MASIKINKFRLSGQVSLSPAALIRLSKRWIALQGELTVSKHRRTWLGTVSRLSRSMPPSPLILPRHGELSRPPSPYQTRWPCLCLVSSCLRLWRTLSGMLYSSRLIEGINFSESISGLDSVNNRTGQEVPRIISSI